MILLRRLKLRSKLALLPGMAARAGVSSTGAGGTMLYHRMLDDRIEKLRTAVEMAVRLANGRETEVQAEKLTHAGTKSTPGPSARKSRRSLTWTKRSSRRQGRLGGSLRLEFALDAATAALFHGLPARLALRHAASVGSNLLSGPLRNSPRCFAA
jgi:hypothetical protein